MNYLQRVRTQKNYPDPLSLLSKGEKKPKFMSPYWGRNKLVEKMQTVFTSIPKGEIVGIVLSLMSTNMEDVVTCIEDCWHVDFNRYGMSIGKKSNLISAVQDSLF